MITLDPLRWMSAALLLASYLLLCGFAWRAGRRQGLALMRDVPAVGWQIVFASQTGNAEEIAMQSADSFRQTGVPVCCYPLAQLDAVRLEAGGNFLFVVSTAGDGEAPDNGGHFARHCLGQGLDLRRVHFGLLALGDRHYPQFNAFGRRLDAWLQEAGARRAFDRIDLDRCDSAGLACWRQHLSRLSGAPDVADWVSTDFLPWRLVERHYLNPGSLGHPVYRLVFQAPGEHEWESGDLAQVRIPADADHPREYSIASAVGEGSLQLLVRQHVRADGSAGLASTYLTQGLPLGEVIPLRIRPHPGFRLAGNAGAPLLLIGSGVGLAGLRGHLATRIAAGQRNNWLIFGERCAAVDYFCREELESWQAQGALQRLDVVFSRDGGATRYVQDVLSQAAEAVRQWIGYGAAIYVCGSRKGMGEEVDRILADMLGRDSLEALAAEGRYRRDVF